LPQNCPEPIAKLLDQFAHTADGMFAVNPQHRIIAWNKAAETLLGYSAEEVVGRCCYEVIQGRDGNGSLQCSESCPHFEQGKKLRWVRHVDLQSRSKSGQDVWISITTVSIVSAQRKLSALVHLFRDVQSPQALPTSEAGRESPSSVDASSPLSRRELTVLRLLAESLGIKEIGEQLFISPKTVKNHTDSILRKLQVHSRLAAVLVATRQHWI